MVVPDQLQSVIDDFNQKNPPPLASPSSAPLRPATGPATASASIAVVTAPATTRPPPPQPQPPKATIKPPQQFPKELSSERLQRIKFLPAWSQTHVEYTLITFRETGSENRYLFFTEYRFPNEDGVPRSQEIRAEVTTPQLAGRSVSVVKFNMQAKRDGVATKDFAALIVSEDDMFETGLLKRGAATGERVSVIIAGRDFRDFNTQYEERYGYGLMDWDEYSRQRGHTDGKYFIERFVFGIESESGPKEFRKLLHVRFGALERHQQNFKLFTAIVIEEAVFLLPGQGQEDNCSPAALYWECYRLYFGDRLTKTKLGEKGKEKRVKFTFRGKADLRRIVVLTARIADKWATTMDPDVIPVEGKWFLICFLAELTNDT